MGRLLPLNLVIPPTTVGKPRDGEIQFNTKIYLLILKANQSKQMALTESTMLKLGTTAPDFSLPNIDGANVSRKDFEGSPLLVMFICNHCPYVKHLADKLAEVTKEYAASGVAVVGVQSNDVENYPADGPEEMKQEAAARGYEFPYLLDDDQSVARAYTAACTPDFFLFDADHKLVYRGRFDKTRPKRIESGVYESGEDPATGADLTAAVEKLAASQPVSEDQKPSVGCNVKWKAGNEPDYFVST